MQKMENKTPENYAKNNFSKLAQNLKQNIARRKAGKEKQKPDEQNTTSQSDKQ